jgi:hypothetical protein
MSKSARRATVDDSAPIAQPDPFKDPTPDPPRRKPLGEGDRCEACGKVCKPEWVDSTKRYECGDCPQAKALPNGVIPRSDRLVARYCGVCRKEIAATADRCSHCSPLAAPSAVQNIATPSRIRADGKPGMPWLR